MMVAWAHHILGMSDAILSGRRFNHLSVYRRWPVTSHFEKQVDFTLISVHPRRLQGQLIFKFGRNRKDG